MSTKKDIYRKKPKLVNINGHDVMFYNIKNKTIQINCFVKNGFIFETQKNLGISHLLEHVITNAWKKCNYKECAIYWGKRGVSYNASTSLDGIVYTIHGINKYIDDILEYIVTIINNPLFINTNLNNEKEAVISELLTKINNKQYKMFDSFNQNFYKIPVLQDKNNYKLQLQNLKKFTIKDISEWYNQYYNKFLFCIVGDFNKQKIIKYLSNNLKKSHSCSYLIRDCFSYSNKLIYINEPSSKQTNIIWGFPSYINKTSTDILRLYIVTSIMQSILFKILRTKLKLIYGIKVGFNIDECGCVIYIFVNTDNDKTDKVFKNIIKIIQTHQNKYCDATEITAHKNNFKYNYHNDNINNKIIMKFYSQQYFHQFNKTNKVIYSLFDLKKIVNNITRKTLLDLFVKFFNLEKSLLVYQSNKQVI